MTGYSMPVANGAITELRDFIVLCTDAFGSNDLQLLKVDNSYIEKYNKTQKQLNVIRKMSDDEFYEFSKAKLLDEMTSITFKIEQRKEEDQRLSDMLAKVESWVISSEYDDLKKYMVDQLSKSINTLHLYIVYAETIENLEIRFEELATQLDDERKKAIAALEHDLFYYIEQHNKEVRMVNDSNKWIEGLLKSLP